jgi:hypothetical protein
MIRVETNTFEASHGKKPRGYGHWMFETCITGHGTPVLNAGFTGMYSEAKRTAIKWARSYGEIAIKVLP